MMTLKGLPSTYNKDLQEDKEPLFDTVDNTSACLKIAEGLVSTMEVHADKMYTALTMDVLATDLADYLVRKGVGLSGFVVLTLSLSLPFQIPFRETHHISGRAVALAEARRCQISDLTMSDFKDLSDHFDEDVVKVFDFEASVERREAIGGTSRKMVERQISVLRELLEKQN